MMRILFLPLALTLSCHAAITNPVDDYIFSKGSQPDPNPPVMAIPCDLDGDGIRDYLLSDGPGIDGKDDYAYWNYYRGLPGGGYEKFRDAVDESGKKISISFVPSRAEWLPVPASGRHGFAEVVQVRGDERRFPTEQGQDAASPWETHRWIYGFSGGAMTRTPDSKTTDPKVYQGWLDQSGGRSQVRDFVVEAELLRKGKPGKLALMAPGGAPRIAPAVPWGWISGGVAALIAAVLVVVLRRRKIAG